MSGFPGGADPLALSELSAEPSAIRRLASLPSAAEPVERLVTLGSSSPHRSSALRRALLALQCIGMSASYVDLRYDRASAGLRPLGSSPVAPAHVDPFVPASDDQVIERLPRGCGSGCGSAAGGTEQLKQ